MIGHEFDLSERLGVIFGVVAVNNEAPGEGHSLCVLVEADTGSLTTCFELPADGGFRLLLPQGSGAAAICPTSEIRVDDDFGRSIDCVPDSLTFTRNLDDLRILGTFEFDVRAGMAVNPFD